MGAAAAVVGAAGAGLAGQFITGRRIAEAQAGAAEAELAEARRTREQAIELAEPTPEELAQIDRAVELNEQDIARKTKLIEASDPAIIEAGRQALQLLRGEEARTLDPVRRARQEQRERLQDTLRSELGSGFATSTAGQQALNRFDQETDSLLAQEQDRSLGRLLGVAERTTQQQGLAGAVRRTGGLADLIAAPGRRQASLISQTPITPFAGAQFVGDIKRAQNLQNLFGQLTGISAAAGGALLAQPTGGTSLQGLLGGRPTSVGGTPEFFAGGRSGQVA
jgi:hypothetical protein